MAMTQTPCRDEYGLTGNHPLNPGSQVLIFIKAFTKISRSVSQPTVRTRVVKLGSANSSLCCSVWWFSPLELLAMAPKRHSRKAEEMVVTPGQSRSLRNHLSARLVRRRACKFLPRKRQTTIRSTSCLEFTKRLIGWWKGSGKKRRPCPGRTCMMRSSIGS